MGHEENRFLRLLDHLEGHHECIVPSVDVLETLEGSSPDCPEERVRRALRAHRAVVRRLLQPRCVWIRGQHDAVTGPMIGARREWLIRADGIRIYCTHGHPGDPVHRRARRLGELAVWIGGWIRRMGGRALFRFFEGMDRMFSGIRADPEARPFRHRAGSEPRTRCADVVITGHSHEGGSLHGNRLYLNSGACLEGRTSFLSLDTHGRRFEHYPAWGLRIDGDGLGGGLRERRREPGPRPTRSRSGPRRPGRP